MSNKKNYGIKHGPYKKVMKNVQQTEDENVQQVKCFKLFEVNIDDIRSQIYHVKNNRKRSDKPKRMYFSEMPRRAGANC